MAVYTVLDREEVEAFIKPFGIGPLIDYEGVAAGIENTNYFLSTDQSNFPTEFTTAPIQHFVLTIFESANVSDLDFFIQLTTMLNQQGLPVPCPIQDADGNAIRTLYEKPALIMPKLPGEHIKHPNAEQCSAIGKILGKIHLVCQSSDLEHKGSRDLSWLGNTIETLRPMLDSIDGQLLDELERFQQITSGLTTLPTAVIHSDLFRDNALFSGNQLTGVIDFNSAGNGYLMYDLAVTANDWCSKADGSLDQELVTAILTAYQTVRPFTASEKELWNDFLRVAATRFWVSRLAVKLQPEIHHRRGGLVEPKNPQHYKNILIQRIHSPQAPL